MNEKHMMNEKWKVTIEEKWEAVIEAWPIMTHMEPENIFEFLKSIADNVDEISKLSELRQRYPTVYLNRFEVLERWFLPTLFHFESVKELFDVLDRYKSVSTRVDTPLKEYILQIKFSGRERGIPLNHPDFDNHCLNGSTIDEN